MTEREPEADENRIDRRGILKGAAAAGLAGTALSGTASAQDRKELRFQSVGDEIFRYRVSVSGTLERAPNRDGGDDLIDENTAEGAARGGNHDDWYFTGEITELELDGPGRVLVDGEVVRDTTVDLPHKIRIEGEEGVDYEFQVSGQIQKASTADAGDRIVDGDTVRGGVGTGGVDEFRYSGDVSFPEVDGEIDVTLEFNQA